MPTCIQCGKTYSPWTARISKGTCSACLAATLLGRARLLLQQLLRQVPRERWFLIAGASVLAGAVSALAFNAVLNRPAERGASAVATANQAGGKTQTDPKGGNNGPGQTSQKAPTAAEVVRALAGQGYVEDPNVGIVKLFTQPPWGMLMYRYHHQGRGATLQLDRDLIARFGFNAPGDQFVLRASREKANVHAFLDLVKSLWPHLHKPCQDKLSEQQQMSGPIKLDLAHFRIVVDSKTIQLASPAEFLKLPVAAAVPDVAKVEATLKQEGFKLFSDSELVVNPGPGGTGGQKRILYIYTKDKIQLNLVRDTGPDGPGQNWGLFAGKEPGDREQLVSLAKKLSPAIGQAAEATYRAFQLDGKAISRKAIDGVDRATIGINAEAFSFQLGL